MSIQEGAAWRSGYSGSSRWWRTALFCFLLKRELGQMDQRHKDLLEQIKAVEREAKADTQKVEEKLDRFITELPFKYTLKDDFVRTVARMENKLDKILDRLNPGDHP